jgi:hypothetical protein
MWNNRSALRKAGLLYPGLSPDSHFHAVMDLQSAHFQEHFDTSVPGAWQRLVVQARAWPGPVVLSHELFSMADAAMAAHALRDLEWAEVHVVHTARDLGRQIPAVWQEDVKNRQVLSFSEFAGQLRTTCPDSHFLANLFWRLQDFPRVLAVWAAHLPPERVHLVTVPPRGAPPDELWTRFAGAIGLDRDACDLSLARNTNASMGLAETNLLRRLNRALIEDFDWPSYDALIKDYLAIEVLGGRDGRVPLNLPGSDYDWVRERSLDMVRTVQEAGYRVFGDLDDLTPAAPRPDTRHPDQPTEAEVLDSAVHALASLLRQARDQRAPDQPAWRQATIRLSQRHAALRQLRHGYLSSKARLSGRRGR